MASPRWCTTVGVFYCRTGPPEETDGQRDILSIA